MIPNTVAVVIEFACVFALGAVVGQWDTKRIYKRILRRRDQSFYEVYCDGVRDGRDQLEREARAMMASEQTGPAKGDKR